MTICDCGPELGIPVANIPRNWLYVVCANGALAVSTDDLQSAMGCGPSGTFGVGQLNYTAAGANVGAPVYCSPSGLRTVPEHYSIALKSQSEAATNPLAIQAGGSYEAWSFSGATINNPSPARPYAVEVNYELAAVGSALAFCVDASLALKIESAPLNGSHAVGTYTVWRGNPSAMSGLSSKQMQISGSISDAFIIPPGGSGILQVRPVFTIHEGGVPAGVITLYSTTTAIATSR